MFNAPIHVYLLIIILYKTLSCAFVKTLTLIMNMATFGELSRTFKATIDTGDSAFDSVVLSKMRFIFRFTARTNLLVSDYFIYSLNNSKMSRKYEAYCGFHQFLNVTVPVFLAMHKTLMWCPFRTDVYPRWMKDKSVASRAFNGMHSEDTM